MDLLPDLTSLDRGHLQIGGTTIGFPASSFPSLLHAWVTVINVLHTIILYLSIYDKGLPFAPA